jgi:hypothetical protein
MSRRSVAIALLATALVAVGPTRDVGAGAARFDLNGTWTGTVKCKSFKAGAKAKSTLTATLKLAQSGLELGILLDVGTSTTNYTGIANPDAKKPFDKGELALVSCTTNDQLGDDLSFDEIGRMAVKAKRGQPKGSLKGTTLFSRPGTIGAEAGTCKWSFKRTVDDFPEVPFTCVFGIGTP